jgi:hypothetical protein
MTKMRRRPKKSACTIMISCNEPTEDGKMQVEMTCEGDEILAAYLLQSAQSILDNRAPPSSKVSTIGN